MGRACEIGADTSKILSINSPLLRQAPKLILLYKFFENILLFHTRVGTRFSLSATAKLSYNRPECLFALLVPRRPFGVERSLRLSGKGERKRETEAWDKIEGWMDCIKAGPVARG